MKSDRFKEELINQLSNSNDKLDFNNITIEKFIDFDENNLADHKILYVIFGRGWLWFYNMAVLLILISEILAFFYVLISVNPNYWVLTIYLPGSLTLFFLVRSYRKKISPILKKYNDKFNKDLKPNYNIFKDKALVNEIQNILFKNYLQSNNLLLSSKQIREIIEALKYDASGTNYIYQSLTTGISFLAIILGAFLGSWFRISTSLSDFVNIATKAAVSLIIALFFFFYIEDSFIKDFIRNKRNRHKRLIRILENYNLNYFGEDH